MTGALGIVLKSLERKLKELEIREELGSYKRYYWKGNWDWKMCDVYDKKKRKQGKE